MIQIERLRMRLPKGFEHRATSIARMVGEILATKNIVQSYPLETVSVTPPRILLNTPDKEIANLIVKEIIAASEGRNA